MGARFSAEEDGHRWGTRFIYRHRWHDSEKAYWQLAPGLSFLGEDHKKTVAMPTGFCELELGHERWGALSFAVEVVPYRDLGLGLVYNPETFYYEEVFDKKGTEVSYYVGAKAAGWKGALIVSVFMVSVFISLKDSLY